MGKPFSSHDFADEGDDSSNTSLPLISHSSTTLDLFRYPVQIVTLNPTFFRLLTKLSFETLDLGNKNSVDLSNVEFRNLNNSSELRDFAHKETVTPSLKQALAVPSPIAIHCNLLMSLFSFAISTAHLAANGDVRTRNGHLFFGIDVSINSDGQLLAKGSRSKTGKFTTLMPLRIRFLDSLSEFNVETIFGPDSLLSICAILWFSITTLKELISPSNSIKEKLIPTE